MTDQEIVKEVQDRIPHLSSDDLRAIYQITGKLLRASVRNTIKDKADGKGIFFMDYQFYASLPAPNLSSVVMMVTHAGMKLYIVVPKEVKTMAQLIMSNKTGSIPSASISTVKKVEMAKGTLYTEIVANPAVVFVEELPPGVTNAIPIVNTNFDIRKAIENLQNG